MTYPDDKSERRDDTPVLNDDMTNKHGRARREIQRTRHSFLRKPRQRKKEIHYSLEVQFSAGLGISVRADREA